MAAAALELMQRSADGTRWEPQFHRGQWRAWESGARMVVVLAGTQSGKTAFGPHWFLREITECGPGDYAVISPTFPLMELKALKEFKRFFIDHLDLGTYVANPIRCFTFSEKGMRATFPGWERGDPPTQVYFGYAADPDSLESATYKAVWCDEAGQQAFKLGSYEALRRRTSIHRGRMLFTTTIYNMGWLKTELYDRWKAGDPEIEVIQFDSTENPAFPMEEYEERRRSMPRWKFDMMYRGLYTRPAGLIYDVFDTRRHVIDAFPIPETWQRSAGIDFGGINTCGLLFAEDPDNKRLIVYHEYHPGEARTEREHIGALLAQVPKTRSGERMRVRAWGGSHQEGGWRSAWGQSGLPVLEPSHNSVEVQISRVYAALKGDEVQVTRDCPELIAQFGEYQRVVDAQGEPTEEIEDDARYHHLAALRYRVSQFVSTTPARPLAAPSLASLPYFIAH